MRSLIRFIFQPVFSFMYVLRARDGRTRLTAGIEFLIVLPLWCALYATGAYAAITFYTRIGERIGFIYTPIYISGTGSMYPTFPKGKGETLQERAQENVAEPLMRAYPGGFNLNGTLYFQHQLEYGDIVSFSNEKTDEIIAKEGIQGTSTTGFVKRVIALPGDTLEIRDGFVYRNGEKLVEPYTAQPRSTFGGEFIADCKTVVVPDHSVVVFGDNRKASGDSRQLLGFVDIRDIDRVLPWKEQTPYSTLWRDTSYDNEGANTPLLDGQKYVKLLNELRKKNGSKPLTYQSKLQESARLRAQAMLKYDDLSFEATRSGLTMQKAMSKVGYNNIIYGEAPTLGYYTAEELLENYVSNPAWTKFLVNNEYQDVGVASVIGNLHDCPVQLVVLHMAGYIPPSYKPEEAQSWQQSADQIGNVLVTWEKTREYGKYYDDHKDDIEHLIEILKERRDIANSIATRIAANQWLTEEDRSNLERDTVLAKEGQDLALKLNTY